MVEQVCNLSRFRVINGYTHCSSLQLLLALKQFHRDALTTDSAAISCLYILVIIVQESGWCSDLVIVVNIEIILTRDHVNSRDSSRTILIFRMHNFSHRQHFFAWLNRDLVDLRLRKVDGGSNPAPHFVIVLKRAAPVMRNDLCSGNCILRLDSQPIFIVCPLILVNVRHGSNVIILVYSFSLLFLRELWFELLR